MTDNTQPEALRLAKSLDLAKDIDYYNHVQDDLKASAAELRRQHARIAELEAQLDSIGAGGVNGPLIGSAFTAADMPEGITRDDTVHGETYYTAADMATASAQGFRDGVASLSAAEPAKADSVQEDALSDSVRVPLDSLHADAAYLIGRLREGSMPYARVIEIIRERIDAAKAAIRASAARAPADSVQEDAARYRWLRRWKGQEHEPPFTVQHEIDGTLWGGDLDAAIDAARKQGGTHDHP